MSGSDGDDDGFESDDSRGSPDSGNLRRAMPGRPMAGDTPAEHARTQPGGTSQPPAGTDLGGSSTLPARRATQPPDSSLQPSGPSSSSQAMRRPSVSPPPAMPETTEEVKLGTQATSDDSFATSMHMPFPPRPSTEVPDFSVAHDPGDPLEAARDVLLQAGSGSNLPSEKPPRIDAVSFARELSEEISPTREADGDLGYYAGQPQWPPPLILNDIEFPPPLLSGGYVDDGGAGSGTSSSASQAGLPVVYAPTKEIPSSGAPLAGTMVPAFAPSPSKPEISSRPFKTTKETGSPTTMPAPNMTGLSAARPAPNVTGLSATMPAPMIDSFQGLDKPWSHRDNLSIHGPTNGSTSLGQQKHRDDSNIQVSTNGINLRGQQHPGSQSARTKRSKREVQIASFDAPKKSSSRQRLHVLDQKSADPNGFLEAIASTSPAAKKVKSAEESAWNTNSKANVRRSRSVCHDSEDHLARLKHQEWSSAGSVQTNAGMKDMLGERFMTTENLIKALISRIECNEHVLQQVCRLNFQLDKELEAKKAPLFVAEKRIELRSRRPGQELIRDHFQEALQHEQAILSKARTRLAELLQAGNTCRVTLESAKEEMAHELQVRRHAARLERSALMYDAYHGVDRICALPRVQKAGVKDESPALSPRNGQPSPTQQSIRAVRSTLDHSRAAEDKAKSFINAGTDLLAQMKRDTEAATIASHNNMQRRIKETQDLRRLLDKSLADNTTMIARTEHSLAKLRHEMQRQEVVLEHLHRQAKEPLSKFDQRLPEQFREEMRREAERRIDEQVQATRKNLQILQERSQDAEGLLQTLNASRRQLLSDSEHKSAARTIDVTCSKLTVTNVHDGAEFSTPRALAAIQIKKPNKKRQPPPLDPEMVETVRQKIRAAAYTGHAGAELDVLFTRFDRDGSGQLDEEEFCKALRRTLRITPEAISDTQIASLCAMLDTDYSGTLSIDEIVSFVGAEPGLSRRERRALQNAENEKIWNDNFNSEMKKKKKQDLGKRKRNLRLRPEVVQQVRAKINAASYQGHLGRELEALFNRFDRNGNGTLDEDEVRTALRRNLKVSPDIISDCEITTLFYLLDEDNSGSVTVKELVAFVGPEPTVSKRTGKKVGVSAEQPLTVA